MILKTVLFYFRLEQIGSINKFKYKTFFCVLSLLLIWDNWMKNILCNKIKNCEQYLYLFSKHWLRKKILDNKKEIMWPSYNKHIKVEVKNIH